MARTYKDVYALEDNPLVRCDCGRWQNADMLIDIRALTPEQRQEWGIKADAAFICDVCVWRALKRVSWEDLQAAIDQDIPLPEPA